MTAETFFEAEQALKNFPVAALAKKISNKNLVSLRKKPFDLNIHSKLMAILRKKYGLDEGVKSTKSIQEELDYLQIPKNVQDSVKSTLQLSGTNSDEKLVQTLLLEECVPGTDTWTDILESINLENLDESELCKIFGFDPQVLQDKFGELFTSILTVFKFFNSGNIPDKMSAHYSQQADQIPEMSAPYQKTSNYMSKMTVPYQTSKNNSRSLTNLTDIKHQTPDIKTMIRLLMFIYDKLSSGLAFSKNTLVRLPYIFSGLENFQLDFNHKTKFSILTIQPSQLFV